jgi:hypothetical protein
MGVFGEVSLKPIDTVEILGNLRFDAFMDSDGRIVTDGLAQTFSGTSLAAKERCRSMRVIGPLP